MDAFIDKFKGLPLAKRLLFILGLALAYPALVYTEEAEVLEENLESAQVSLNSSKSRLKVAEDKVKMLPKLEAEIRVIDQQLAEARKFLPDVIEFDEILASLGSYEKEFDVQIVKFVPGESRKPSQEASYSEVPLDLILRSDFSRVMLFLDKLVHRKDLVHIRRMDFKSYKEQKQKDQEVDSDSPALVELRAEIVFYRKDG